MSRSVKYYSGAVEVKSVFSMLNKEFELIGGIKSKHNQYNSVRRLVGHTASGPDLVLPVTRRIDYKTNSRAARRTR